MGRLHNALDFSLQRGAVGADPWCVFFHRCLPHLLLAKIPRRTRRRWPTRFFLWSKNIVSNAIQVNWHEAEINFENWKNEATIRGRLNELQKFHEIVRGSQMPPIDSAQPTDAERKKLSDWSKEFLLVEAQTYAGDPGPVVLRSLEQCRVQLHHSGHYRYCFIEPDQGISDRRSRR